jgi:hypothetical protein
MCLFIHKWEEIFVTTRASCSFTDFLGRDVRKRVKAAVEECSKCKKQRAYLETPDQEQYPIAPWAVLPPEFKTPTEPTN